MTKGRRNSTRNSGVPQGVIRFANREEMKDVPDKSLNGLENKMKYPNQNNKWTQKEDRFILERRREGIEIPYNTIGFELGRSPQACRLRDMNLRIKPKLLGKDAPADLRRLAMKPSVKSKAHREQKKAARAKKHTRSAPPAAVAATAAKPTPPSFRPIVPAPPPSPEPVFNALASFGALTIHPAPQYSGKPEEDGVGLHMWQPRMSLDHILN